jgi:hypothetical protein
LLITVLSEKYRPLSIIVNVALLLGVLSDLLYLSSFPYSEKQRNCSEVFVGRVLDSDLELERREIKVKIAQNKECKCARTSYTATEVNL